MENNKAYALLKQENDFLTQEIDSREKRMQEFEDMINNLKENVNEISKEKNELEINLTQELEKINMVSTAIRNNQFIPTPGKVCKDCSFNNICEYLNVDIANITNLMKK